ncbi:MAG: Dabb family protein, partial [Microthrixaceae bacterium]|nr:Dabb family protein [Microthrixaceae bacterium]
MIRHVVVLTLTETTPRDHAERIVAELRGLPGSIPELVDYRVGVDLGLAEGNATIAVTADFADADGWATYRDHPDHV